MSGSAAFRSRAGTRRGRSEGLRLETKGGWGKAEDEARNHRRCGVSTHGSLTFGNGITLIDPVGAEVIGDV